MSGEYHWLETILGLIGGGAIAGIISALVQKKKTKNDIVAQNIETARQLRDDAIQEYRSIKDNLEQCRILLEDAQRQLDVAKDYIEDICGILDKSGIEYPPKPEEIFGK